MPEETILRIDLPHLVVKLDEDTLQVDLKKGARKELEDALEASPILRESLGILFQTVIPLDIRLCDIDSTKIDREGRLRVVIPLRRDILIPLKTNESKRLKEKLDELVPLAKEREAERKKALDETEERPKRKMREME